MSGTRKTKSADRFEAGRKGPGVRSDLHVSFEPGSDSLDIDLRSRVEPYYGEAIRKQVATVFDQLGVAGGRALPGPS